MDPTAKIPMAQLPDLTRTILDQSGNTKVPLSSVIMHGAKADYTGRIGTVRTGTDDRRAIQSALDAASDVSDPSYYGYLTRRSVTVKLPAGFYLISAPTDGTASLKVPSGVLLIQATQPYSLTCQLFPRPLGAAFR